MAQMKYFYELTISSSPHAHSPVTTRTIMRDVCIALLPALIALVPVTVLVMAVSGLVTQALARRKEARHAS